MSWNHSPSRRRFVALAVALVVAGAAGALARRSIRGDEGFRCGLFDPPREAPDFELDGSGGARVRLAAYRGKVVILEFGFTTCQQICPVTLAHLAQVYEKLGARAVDVQVIFVTVDPKRDDPARMRAFLAPFNASFLGASGTPAALESVRAAYGIVANEVVFPNNDVGYDHSSFVYLIDRTGKVRVLVPFGKPVEDILHDVDLLLKS